MEIVNGTTPCSMNEPNYTCVGEPHQDGENSNVHNVPIQQQSEGIMEVVSGSSASTQISNPTHEGLQNKDTSRVYTRRKYRSQMEATNLDLESTPELCPLEPVHESEPEIIDVSSAFKIGVEDSLLNDLPIALRKGTRTKVGMPPLRYGFEHDIANYVSYTSLSPAYIAYIASLQSAKIPRVWKEAKQDPSGVRPCWRSWELLKRTKLGTL
jgi:hypothetical protein